MGISDEFDDDDSYGEDWRSDAERTEEILEQFRIDSLNVEVIDHVRAALDEAGIEYRKVIGEYDADQGTGILRVVLEDGTEVTIP